MGRLIDADLFKQQMSALALTSPSFFTSKVVKLLEIIDKQPTAFDVEAVVKEVQDQLYCYDIPTDLLDDIIRKGGVK